jgi:hypothetical protein
VCFVLARGDFQGICTAEWQAQVSTKQQQLLLLLLMLLQEHSWRSIDLRELYRQEEEPALVWCALLQMSTANADKSR